MNSRYQGKAWDRHFLPRLTTSQIAALPKEDAVIVLPIGAIEQHGAHLPTFTDTMLAEGGVTQAFNHLPDDANIWLLPTLSYSKSTEHLNHPGTITLSASTLMAVLMDIGQSLQRSGFRKWVFWNCHGGNIDLLQMMAREIRIATGIAVFCLHMGVQISPEGILTPEEKKHGMHGGDEETSMMMVHSRHWVHDQLRVKEYFQSPSSPFLQLSKRSIAWTIDDLTASGILGDATLASVEKGKRLIEEQGRLLAQALLDIADFDMSQLRADSV